MRSRLPSLAALALAIAFPSPGFPAADFGGKTITALVGFSAGGPVDGFARLIASRLGMHLSGRPSIVVQNKPGADGVVAANYLFNAAPKDGSMFLVTIAPFTNQFIDAREIRFEMEKFFWLGALNYSNAIYASSDLDINGPADIPTARKQIVIGGLGPNSSRDLYMRSFLETLGSSTYKYVKGYQGTVDIRTAMLRREVNFSTESVVALTTDLSSYVRDGSIIPLVQSGLTQDGKMIRDPSLLGVPLAEDAGVAVKGDAVRGKVEFRGMNLVISMFTLGRAILLPPGVDPEAAAALREAMRNLKTDREFMAGAQKLNGGVPMRLTDGADAQRYSRDVTRLVKSDHVAHQYLEELAQRK